MATDKSSSITCACTRSASVVLVHLTYIHTRWQDSINVSTTQQQKLLTINGNIKTQRSKQNEQDSSETYSAIANIAYSNLLC